MAVPPLSELERTLSIQFRNNQLLQQAFVHRSYLNELPDNDDQLVDNERLEFLGDAVLSYIFSELLYEQFPDEHEGGLTNLRSALVRRETLARLATRLHLGKYLLLGHGEEESGGRLRQATLCATFEALIGALYLDQRIDTCREVVLRLFSSELARLEQRRENKDAKSKLQELAQEKLGKTPRYRQLDSTGPDHDKFFVMVVQIDGAVFGAGEGRSKQEASQKAAAMALYFLGAPLEEYILSTELGERYHLILPDVPSNDGAEEGC